MHTIDTCPSCGNNASTLLVQCRDFIESGEAFGVRQCGGCGFLFTNPQPDEQEIGKYYASAQYAPLSHDARGWIHTVSRLVRTVRLPIKRRFVERVAGRRAGTLLDIGCGTGEFGGAMVRAGWRVSAIEPDERGRANAAALGIDVRPPTALREFPDHSFDVVTLWHSLEHIHDVDGTLGNVARLLRPGGTAIIAVPNADCLDAVVYGADWYAWDVPRHLWHFTPATLSARLGRHGLAMASVQGSAIESVYVCLRSEQVRGGNVLRGVWIGLRSAWNGWRRPQQSSTMITVIRAA